MALKPTPLPNHGNGMHKGGRMAGHYTFFEYRHIWSNLNVAMEVGGGWLCPASDPGWLYPGWLYAPYTRVALSSIRPREAARAAACSWQQCRCPGAALVGLITPTHTCSPPPPRPAPPVCKGHGWPPASAPRPRRWRHRSSSQGGTDKTLTCNL